MANILKINKLCKRYRGKTALEDLSLEVESGQICGILGPNGSGKTTTLSIILGITRATKGSYSWFNQDQEHSNRKRIGSLLEKPCFYPHLTAYQNLSLVAKIRDIAKPHTAISSVLEIVDLQKYPKLIFQEFSLGMKQRLAIASTMLGKPDVLLLDEPTNGIDAKGIADIRNSIYNWRDEGGTVILASHILDEVEKICSHVLVLKNGITLDCGAIKDVLSNDEKIEIASDNIEELNRVLHGFPEVMDIENHKEILKISLNTDTSLPQLNKKLSEQNIFVSHLCQRKKSLETHFLKLLDS